MAKNTGRNIAVGALIAGAAGYVAGILTAPKSGKETRKEIREKAAAAKVEGEKKLKLLHTELDKLIEQGKKSSTKFSASAQKEWAVAVKAALVARDKVRGILSALHEGDADDKDLDKAMKQAEEAVQNLKKYLTKDA
jgi:gas vesicle protein